MSDWAADRHDFFNSLKARGYAATSLLTKSRNLDEFLSFLTRQYIFHLEEVTPTVIEGYHRHLLGRKSRVTGLPLSASILIQYLGVVGQFFRHLLKRRRILLDPTLRLTLPREAKALPRHIPTESDMEKILLNPNPSTHIGKRDRALLEVLYSTAIRRRELVNLNVGDIDLVRGLLTVRGGKGGKDRMVPLGRRACQAVTAYLAIRPLFQGLPAPHHRPRLPYEAALFLNEDGRRLQSLSLGRLVRRHALEALGRPVSCHKFRHACATHMLKGGAHVRLVQDLLGHKDLNTTQLYTQVLPLDLKEAHRRAHPRGRMDKRQAQQIEWSPS
jgi:integrase/recombinase XerD